MGWLTLYHNGRDDPSLSFEDWPHQVHQPVGDAFAEFPDAARAARLPDDALLGRHPGPSTTAVTSETLGRPGAAEPDHIVLRRSTGFGRAAEVDTGLAAVVGACDGDLPLGVLIDAVADLLDVDAGRPARRPAAPAAPADRATAILLPSTASELACAGMTPGALVAETLEVRLRESAWLPFPREARPRAWYHVAAPVRPRSPRKSTWQQQARPDS